MKLIGTFAGAAVAAAILATDVSAEAQVVTLRFESPVPAMQPASLSMQIFKDETVRLSRGEIEVEIVPDSSRGRPEATIDALRAGKLFGTWMSVGNFSRFVPETAVVGLPFFFDNHEDARRTIVAGHAGSLIAAKFEAKGFTVLTWLDGDALNVTNARRPLKKLDDFKGLTLAVTAGAARLAAFQALGVRTVPIDLKDVGAALRRGNIDGTEQDYSTMFASRSFESQKYLSDTAHFLDFYVVVVDKKAFARLDPAHQTSIWEAAEIASRHERKISAEARATALAKLEDAGVQFDALAPGTRAALRQATAGATEGMKNSVGAGIVNEVLAAHRLSSSAAMRQGGFRSN